MADDRVGEIVEILLVEDSPADVMLTRDAFDYHKVLNPLRVVEDGVDALAYLRREGRYAHCKLPSLIILDLNLPRMSGREVLMEIKRDPVLQCIPVVILTTSTSEEDILGTYAHYANCYITKPVDFDKFVHVIRSIREFWCGVVTLPHCEPPAGTVM
ncbi:response regulator [Trinickia soli]|uniref:Response regulator n=1 Tax=Trinickia soli TaxID=380675 RepID=A0A2N7W3V9_9BURK|nr:response regulator [Trinickia soli]PMS24078.1 response regulator [Trinickia soli]CAB3702254.1 Response regulator rcp1 [Trinickia soli]